MKSFVSFVARLSLVLLLLAAVLRFELSSASAQAKAQIYFKQIESTADTLTVEIIADNVANLYGLELHLKYDPTILAAQDAKADQPGIQIEPATLLPVNQGFVVMNQADNIQGAITYAFTLLNPAPAVTGSGAIARITFKSLQHSPTTLNFEEVILVAISLQTIPVDSWPLTVNESAGASAMPPTADGEAFPWWLVAVFIVGVGVLSLGVVTILIRSRHPRSA
jgi:hypothetical protein